MAGSHRGGCLGWGRICPGGPATQATHGEIPERAACLWRAIRRHYQPATRVESRRRRLLDKTESTTDVVALFNRYERQPLN